MKKILLAVFACSLPGALMAADVQPAAQAPAAGLTDDQKTLYFLGKAVSSKIKQFEFSADESKAIVQGFSESLAGKDAAYTPEEEKALAMKLNEYLGKKQEAVVARQKEAAKPFLEKMAKEKGAKKLPSGVVYIPVKEGKGASPKATDMVKVHYHGTFPDGKVFDSSVERKTPAEFPLNGVIPCWTEGVQKMKVGGKAKLVCPSDTAYGDQGAPGAIPGGATLVFEVELLDIVKDAEAAKPAPKPARKEVKAEPKGAVKEAAPAEAKGEAKPETKTEAAKK